MTQKSKISHQIMTRVSDSKDFGNAKSAAERLDADPHSCLTRPNTQERNYSSFMNQKELDLLHKLSLFVEDLMKLE